MKRIAALALLALVATTATAGEKPRVQVGFKISEPDYLTDFTDAEVAWIEAEIAAVLVERLGPEFRFVEFTTGGGDHALSVELRALGQTNEVGFHFNLEGTRAVDKPVYSVFRHATAAGVPLSDKESFKREIELSLDALDRDQVGKRLLRRIPIPAQGTELIKTPWLGWKMPFTLSELCMDRDSVVLVESSIPVGEFSMDEAFEAESVLLSKTGESRLAQLARPIFAKVRSDQDFLDELQSADPAQVVIRVIYVIDYRAFDEREQCEQLIAPNEVEFGGGS